MKRIIIVMFLLVVGSYRAECQRDLVRIEQKVNTNIQKIEANTDSILSIQNQLDNQFLELENVKSNSLGNQAAIQEEIDKIKTEIGTVEETNVKTKTNLDRFWILIAAALIFLMQAGFKVLEMGMVRKVHGTGIGLKNLIDFVVVAIVYFLVGFAFMFGESSYGLIGTGLFLPQALELEEMFNNGEALFGMEFFIFQLAFAATAATIVSGAMSERTAFVPYILIALFTAGVIYPIVGHMVWGNTYLKSGTAFLASRGFMDFAGGTVVHSVGAWVALIGVWVIGPRIGRFRLDGSVNDEKFKPYSLGYSVLGVFMLWFGWWGFNGGSTLSFSSESSAVINNTNIAAAFAAISALIHGYFTDKKNITVKIIGGVLTGLVAITACANVVDSISAMIIGAIAGVIHNFGYDLLVKFKLDDPVGAIPVHGFGGVWGTVAVGIFGKESLMRNVLNLSADQSWSRGDQIVIQVISILLILLIVSLLSFIFFKILDVTIGLRVNPQKENSGYIFIDE